MIDSRKLLEALRKVLKQVEDFAREHIDAHADLEAGLRAEWQQARDSGRVGSSYHDWRDEEITQAAVHWVLACVYLRFIEDNGLCERPWLSGATRAQRDLAQDRYEQFFRARPLDSDEHYLRACFEDAARLPAMGGLFDRNHNPLWRIGATGDGAKALLDLLRAVDPDTGQILYGFADPDLDTRFLGDLYQDLSEPVRKKYALLQTPIFVEEFILDRTLTPALAEFGYRVVRLIDPTCGSGHFLLGAFRRLFDLWAANEPARNLPDLAQRALDGVYGVDLNPYAVAIARFRLTMAALAAAGIRRLADAPDFQVHVAVGDSLLHGRRFTALDLGGEAENLGSRSLAHAYATEDLEAVNRILGQRYHAVVGNPPYITVKDPALNGLYRTLYANTCHMKYSLVAPFTERFFDLALPASGAQPAGYVAGYVGLIAADSFMKREFGKKLIESFLPRVDLTHVIATSGAYIPGHGTPTVILFGRNRRPVEATVRTVMGIKGEPVAPADPAKGLVWSAILDQVDRPGSEGEFVSVSDVPRAIFAKHPWSIGGGGASDLKELIEAGSTAVLEQMADEVGILGMTNADEVMIADLRAFRRKQVESFLIRPLVIGDVVRDWELTPRDYVVFPYVEDALVPIANAPGLAKWMWPSRTVLGNRATFGKATYFAEGRPWWEWHQIAIRRLREPLTITWGEITTHNHFVLDRGGKVFKQAVPVIKLPSGAIEDDHLAMLGLLNSSAGCFWLKQVCHNKGNGGIGGGIGDEIWERRYVHDGTKVSQFPLVEPYPTDLARRLDTLGRELAECLPAALCASGTPSRAGLDAARSKALLIRGQMVALQEELDWRCYGLYGLIEEDLCFVPSPQPLSSGAKGEFPSPQPLSRGERGLEHSPQRLPQEGSGSSLPSPPGGGAGGEGRKHHGVLPADLLANARDLRKGQTDAESLLWLLLRDRRLGGFKFRRQHPVPPYVLDFYCHEKRLAVELDGGQHAEQTARDKHRTRELEQQGIRVLRYWNNEVLAETEGVLEAIWSVLHEESGADSPHPNPSPGGGGALHSPLPAGEGPGVRGALPEIALGERAFEIVLARRMAQGELETAWFSRHGSTPITQVPAHWPEAYRRLVERRIALIESDRNIGLIERPEYKRRWSWTPWEDQERDALRGCLLDPIEVAFSGRGGSAEPPEGKAPEPRLTSTARLADRLHADAAFMDVAAVYTGRVDFDLGALVAELVESESVPFLPVLRYKDSGLRKRAQWEETWRLQRREDAIDAAVEAEWRTQTDAAAGSDPTAAEALVAEQRRRKQAELGDIPVPPKYASADFLKTSFWRLRGGLDVPKERFVSYPGCERDADRSLPIAWAGWNPLQQAMAIATYYLNVREREAWDARRLTPLLAGIQELLPWILQWHNDYDPESGQRMGDYFAGFVAEEARTLGLTLEALRAWRPVAATGARRGRRPRGEGLPVRKEVL